VHRALSKLHLVHAGSAHATGLQRLAGHLQHRQAHERAGLVGHVASAGAVQDVLFHSLAAGFGFVAADLDTRHRRCFGIALGQLVQHFRAGGFDAGAVLDQADGQIVQAVPLAQFGDIGHPGAFGGNRLGTQLVGIDLGHFRLGGLGRRFDVFRHGVFLWAVGPVEVSELAIRGRKRSNTSARVGGYRD